MMKSLSFLALTLLAFSALADVAGSIVVDKPFVRAAIQQQRNSAVYMNITNHGDNAAITYVKSPVAKIVELHTHINDNGVMRMRKIKQIDLPSHKMVHLKPGGLHVMLLGLNRDLNLGDMIDVTLAFDDGSEKTLQVPVQKMKMKKMKGMKEHKMDGSMPKMMNH